MRAAPKGLRSLSRKKIVRNKLLNDGLLGRSGGKKQSEKKVGVRGAASNLEHKCRRKGTLEGPEQANCRIHRASDSFRSVVVV